MDLFQTSCHGPVVLAAFHFHFASTLAENATVYVVLGEGLRLTLWSTRTYKPLFHRLIAYLEPQ